MGLLIHMVKSIKNFVVWKTKNKATRKAGSFINSHTCGHFHMELCCQQHVYTTKEGKTSSYKGYTWRIYSFSLTQHTFIWWLYKMVCFLWSKAKPINTIHHLNSWLNKWSSLCIVAELVNKCLKRINHAYESQVSDNFDIFQAYEF